MKTKAIRLYGKNDLRLEEFDLPQIKNDEILAKVVSDSICMSSYKAAIQGADHKRVPNNASENPIIIGHEFCGEIIEVGAFWQDEWKPGQRFSIQPALNFKGSLSAPGYSYNFIGGQATYVVIPREVMETGNLLHYNGDAFFYGSLAEPMSCIIGSFHAQYHTKNGCYVHNMEIKEGGAMAILAGAGPMGLGAVDYALHSDIKPQKLVVTDIDDARLARAAELVPPSAALAAGVELLYINTADKTADDLLDLTNGNGFDDVFVFAPVRPVVEMGDKILARDGCLNFFAGPTDPKFSAEFNFYNVHYAGTHIVGTSGGSTEDMKEALKMMEEGKINPAAMITHVGGLDAAVEATLKLPEIKGGKKLIYTHIEMPLVAIEDFEELGKTNEMFSALAKITKKYNGLWSTEAEKYLLGAACKSTK